LTDVIVLKQAGKGRKRGRADSSDEDKDEEEEEEDDDVFGSIRDVSTVSQDRRWRHSDAAPTKIRS
jgi:hypothetical protein